MKFTRSRNLTIWKRSNLRRKLFTRFSTHSSLLNCMSCTQPYENVLKTRRLTTINNFSSFKIAALELRNFWIDWAYTTRLAQRYINLSWTLGRGNYSLFIFIRNYKSCFHPLQGLNRAKSSHNPLSCNLFKYL